MTEEGHNEMKILFLGLSQREVLAYEAIASRLRCESKATPRTFTWLRRFETSQTKALSAGRLVPTRPFELAEQLKDSMGESGIGDVGDFCNYDRDWYFATLNEKRKYGAQVLAKLHLAISNDRPDVLVSAVGGETVRLVAEFLANTYGIKQAYFNAIPLPNRFVLLKSHGAPFIPFSQIETSYRPIATSTSPEIQPDGLRKTPQPPNRPTVLSGIQGIKNRLIRVEDPYPKTWTLRKLVNWVLFLFLSSSRKEIGQPELPGRVRVLYPLHDERDFQVAVRERHAVPQEALLVYVSSVLPPGWELLVKPHPEHPVAHHPIFWRHLTRRSNVTFLPPNISSDEAVKNSTVIFTLASSMGFEAILQGKPVVVYGSPFYCRRGLTLDVRDPRRIVDTLREALEFVPAKDATSAFIKKIHEWSWSGTFTPLVNDPGNHRSLAQGLWEALTNDEA